MHNVLVVAEQFCRLAAEEEKNIRKPYNLTTMKLMKLIYIAHGFKLATKDEPLIGDEIQAWTHGPVIPSLYNAISKQCSGSDIVRHIEGVKEDDLQTLQEVDVELIKKTFDPYYKYSACTLSGITHDCRSPWYYIKKNINKLKCNIIHDEDTKKYYIKLLRNSIQNY